jgi:ABC-type phosphate/phosphonate transport system substrate-binding protein
MLNGKKLLLAGSLVTTLMTAAMPMAHAATSIGVIAPRGELKAMKRWAEFSKYLSAQIGDRVQIKPYAPRNLMKAAQAGEVEFMISNPTQAVILQEVHGANPLATVEKKTGSQFGGVIVAKKGSGITTAEDTKGKRGMALKFRRAAGAYTFQTYHLMQKGIDPHKDFSSFTEGKKQDELILAVKNGKTDVAFVRTGILESMEKEGKIKMSDFVVVDQDMSNTYPQARTTTLYPEWYLTSLKGTDSTKAEKVKAAALSIKASDRAAKKAKIVGFVEPVSMDGMKAALKALKIKPYDN